MYKATIHCVFGVLQVYICLKKSQWVHPYWVLQVCTLTYINRDSHKYVFSNEIRRSLNLKTFLTCIYENITSNYFQIYFQNTITYNDLAIDTNITFISPVCMLRCARNVYLPKKLLPQ